MLELQSTLNTAMFPEGEPWYKRSLDWGQAIFAESAELMDHLGWKWWKDQQPNHAAAKMELVDIWHFIDSVVLEVMINENESIPAIAELVHQDLDGAWDSWENHKAHCSNAHHTVKDLVHTMVNAITMEQKAQPTIAVFSCIVQELDYDFDELYMLYIAKNVLNQFRKDNGYKSGTYIKCWGKEFPEDNDYLMSVLIKQDVTDPDLSATLMTELRIKYDQVKNTR